MSATGCLADAKAPIKGRGCLRQKVMLPIRSGCCLLDFRQPFGQGVSDRCGRVDSGGQSCFEVCERLGECVFIRGACGNRALERFGRGLEFGANLVHDGVRWLALVGAVDVRDSEATGCLEIECWLFGCRGFGVVRDRPRVNAEVGSSNTRPSTRTGTELDLGRENADDLRSFRGYVVYRWTGHSPLDGYC